MMKKYAYRTFRTHFAALTIISLALPLISYADTPEVEAFLNARPRVAETQRNLLGRYAGKYLKGGFKRAAERSKNRLAGSTFSDLKINEAKQNLLAELTARSKFPNSTNWPGFINSHSDFASVIELYDGACFGVTELIRRMNLLAVFDPTNVSGATVPSRTNPKAYFEFFESLLKKIGKNEVAVFPGFHNFLELSSDSLIKRAMLERAIFIWAEKNARLSVVFQMWKSPNFKMRKHELGRLHRDLKERMALHYNPVIFIARPIKEWIHLLQVSAVSEVAADGSWSMTIWDPNDAPPYSQRTITVDRDGNVNYDGPLTEVEIAPGDDAEIGKIAGSLAQFCEQNRSLCDLQSRL